MQKLSCLLAYFFVFYLSAGTVSSYSGQLNGQLNDFNLFEENGKIGLKDASGKIIINAQYEALGWSNGKFSIVNNVTGYKLHGLWGLINTENHRITKPEFQDLSPGEGLILVARKKLPHSVKVQAGCLNISGKVVVPFQYDGLSIASFRAIVYMKSASRFNHGLIDLENKLLIPINFQSIYPLGSLRYGVQNFDNKT